MPDTGIIQPDRSIFRVPEDLMCALVPLRGPDFSSPASFPFTSVSLIDLPNLLY
jgi:hypothetical protein